MHAMRYHSPDVSRLTALTIMFAAAMLGAETVRYRYDAAGRLIAAEYSSGRVINYTYDAAGNLLKQVTGTSTGCVYTLSKTSLTPTTAGGNSTIGIQTGAACAWSVTSLPSWITVSGASSGTGVGSVILMVAANTGPARSATVSIGDGTVTVNQAGAAPCVYTLSAGGQVFLATGGSGTITVTTAAGCAWTASGNPSWVTLGGSGGGTGAGTLTYQVAANTGADRASSIQIAGNTFAIEQVSTTLAGASVAGSMAQIASAGGWKMTITLVNSGTATKQLRLNFFDNSGNPLLLPLTFPQGGAAQLPGSVPDHSKAAATPSAGPLLASTLDRSLNAGASLVIETTGPDAQAVKVGWAQLLSTGNISGFATFTVTASRQEAVVPLETRNASAFRLAFDNTGGLLTGLAIANLSGQAAAIAVIIRDDAGVQIGTATINLSAHGHDSFMLTQNYAVTAGKRGTVEFDAPAGGQISVLGLRANGAALTTLPLLAGITAGGGSMAHVASAGGWQTTFTFVNAGATAADITVTFTGDSGAALSLPLSFPQTGTNTTASTVTRTLAPNASLVIATQGSNSQALVTGSALLATTGSVGGFAIFRDGGTLQEAVVPLDSGTGGAFLLAFDNTNGLVTGLALANTKAQAAVINVTLRDDTGAVIGSPVINLPGLGHTSFLLASNYPATAGKRGTVEFAASGGSKVTGLGIRATPAGTVTTIPTLVK